MVKGHPANAKDMIITGLDAASRETVLADFTPLPGSKLGELSATWDIVLGRTVEEFQDGPIKGFGRPPQNRRR
jgi:protocatechuate 3,4-dioxygenase beta subunit